MNDNRVSHFAMMPLERLWHDQNRTRVLIASAIIVAVVATLDWRIDAYLSMGFLYLFPIILAAAFLPRWAIVLVSVGCAVLAELFSYLEPSLVRLCFIALALTGSGLFAAEMARNRRLIQQSEARLRVLVETSPAAIVTVDERGFIDLANRAALELMAPRQGGLVGEPIAAFLPDLHQALRWEEASQFRASMQCRGHRGSGETFTADIWFSTYREGPVAKLAAIIAEVGEEDQGGLSTAAQPSSNFTGSDQIERVDPGALTSRETNVLQLLVQGLSNKEIAVRVDLSESSVKNTIQQLFARTGVRTRSQLVRVALEHYRHLL